MWGTLNYRLHPQLPWVPRTAANFSAMEQTASAPIFCTETWPIEVEASIGIRCSFLYLWTSDQHCLAQVGKSTALGTGAMVDPQHRGIHNSPFDEKPANHLLSDWLGWHHNMMKAQYNKCKKEKGSLGAQQIFAVKEWAVGFNQDPPTLQLHPPPRWTTTCILSPDNRLSNLPWKDRDTAISWTVYKSPEHLLIPRAYAIVPSSAKK